MNKTSIRTMSNNAIEYIAKAINCTATKAEITKQYKEKAPEIEKAYTAYQLIAKAEAEQRKQQKAEAEAKKQKAIAEAEQKAQKQSRSRKQKTAKQKTEKTEKTDSKTAEQKAEAKQKTAEAKQKAVEAIEKQLKDYEVAKNADGHYILKANNYLVKFQVSAKDVKIRCNKKFAEATQLETELHENWNVKYAVIADTTAVIKAFLQLQKTAEAEAKKAEQKKQKENK